MRHFSILSLSLCLLAPLATQAASGKKGRKPASESSAKLKATGIAVFSTVDLDCDGGKIIILDVSNGQSLATQTIFDYNTPDSDRRTKIGLIRGNIQTAAKANAKVELRVQDKKYIMIVAEGGAPAESGEFATTLQPAANLYAYDPSTDPICRSHANSMVIIDTTSQTIIGSQSYHNFVDGNDLNQKIGLIRANIKRAQEEGKMLRLIVTDKKWTTLEVDEAPGT